MIAARRHIPSVGSVVVINILLGWTVIGWVIALAMSLGSNQPKSVTYVQMTPNNIPYPAGYPNTYAVPAQQALPPGSATAAAGWYPDPHRQATLRYHDGMNWTEHTHN